MQAARGGVRVFRRRAAHDSARQPQRGRDQARHLRPAAQCALRQAARTPRRCRATLPAVRTGPQGQGRVGGRLYAKDGIERAPLREHRRAERVFGALERALGGDAHSRDDEAPSARDVRRGASVSCCRCRQLGSSTTASASAPFTSTAISKSTARTTRHRRAASAARWSSTLDGSGCAFSIPRRTSCLREFPIATRKGQRRTNDADRPKQTPPQVEKLAWLASREPARAAARSRAGWSRSGVLLRCARSLECSICCGATTLRPSIAPACSPRRRALRVCGFVRTYLAHHATPTKLQTQHRIIPEIETYTTHFTTLTQGATP